MSNRDEKGKFQSPNPFKRAAKEIDRQQGNKDKKDNKGWFEETQISEELTYDFDLGEYF